jgi:hypothetical protein
MFEYTVAANSQSRKKLYQNLPPSPPYFENGNFDSSTVLPLTRIFPCSKEILVLARNLQGSGSLFIYLFSFAN